ncbi:hypothetical protein K505DRAFT_422051 [Melanomma pulvis-pyrius CBS 109.77]|uniref:Uncharacterized protein n=1 Tax=Melanomma pulvis-pyrius CBS 109.77 TaxID=1314802 RepID=A0A6A6WSE1_9PLEO|nr:hypothetical protein K505DRAFT_422051 [Melanomma pulvis-pyrius CBS 109.77]
MEPDNSHEIKDLQHSLRTANLELSLEKSRNSVAIVAKDEEIRKIRVNKCLLQDEINELHEQLEEEQARADELEEALDEVMLQLDQHKAEADSVQNQFRIQAREVTNLKAELRAMENVTSDSNKLLSEKLALNREMSSLRPEVEHLRAQVEANQGLLAEKLSLQRQLTTLQVELENEKRTAARAFVKQGRKVEQDEELRSELEELRNELSREKKDRLKAETAGEKAEKAAEKVQANLDTQQRAAEKIQADLDAQQQVTARVQAKLDKAMAKEATKGSKRDAERDAQREAELEELCRELEHEKGLRQKAEKASQKGGQRDAEIEELRQELEQERRERQKAEKAIKKAGQQPEPQADSMRKELDEEKRERKKAEKEFSKSLAELQGRNTVLDDKLGAFREKLRSTKERLKEAEAKLEKAQNTAPTTKATVKPSIEPAAKLSKNARKRIAASVEPETNLGTPGDGFPAKKFKRATSVAAAGDTSTFSLTPFLNRTGSVLPGSPTEEEEAAEHEATPTALPKKAPNKAALPKTKPLVPSASNKANAKPAPRRKKATAPLLEQVVEEVTEHFPVRDNSEHAATSVPLKDADDGPSKGKSLVPKIKARKSLMSFANFTEEPMAEKKKKRKLGAGSGGGLGKTLFDDDEDVVPAKPMTSKGIFAARALGKSVLGKGPQRPISGGYNMMSEENFTFSPLKKDRRGASILRN